MNLGPRTFGLLALAAALALAALALRGEVDPTPRGAGELRPAPAPPEPTGRVSPAAPAESAAPAGATSDDVRVAATGDAWDEPGQAAPAAVRGELPVPDPAGVGPHQARGRVVDDRGAPLAGAAVDAAPYERVGERLRAHVADGEARPDGAPGGARRPGLEEVEGVPSADGTARAEVTPKAHGATTADDGRFTVVLPDAGVVRIRVRAPGFAPLERTVRDAAGGQDLGDLALSPGGVLAGAVRTRAGAPVAGALVHRLDPRSRVAAVEHAGIGELVARTDPAGRFLLSELPAGPWRLLISAERHPDAVFEGAATGTADAPLERDFLLDDGARIAGLVRAATASEAAGVASRPALEVRATPLRAGAAQRAAAVADDGRFELAGLAPGARYRVAGYERGADPSARPRTDEAVVTAGATGVELRLVAETALVFRAVDAASGAPITELEVHLVDGARPAAPSTFLAGPDGRAQRAFPGGAVRFPVVRADGGRTVTLVVWGRRSEPRELTGLVLTPGLTLDLGDVALQPARGLTVSVVSAADGAPVAGAEVTLGVTEEGAATGEVSTALAAAARAPAPPPWRRARTDEHGRVALAGLPSVGATLAVRHPRFVPVAAAPVTQEDHAAGETLVQLTPR